MDERISVVIPVYNTGKFLDRCLESVVNQTYCSLEILLIDDGSTDESGALCDAWAKRDSRIRVIHKQNAGLGMARNTGIDNAKGKYICFFDSDDFVDTGILAAAVETAEREHADITVFGLASADKTGNVKRENIPAGEPLVFSGD
ncbi:MAG: glycosyltransferase family 2 protein, partial [Lentisphaeria bacterium]|nr:glycosyltransferase family 2 protein [Lentisphaeria bacterium]